MLTHLLILLATIKNSPAVHAQAVHTLIGYSVMLTAYRAGQRTRWWVVALVIMVIAFIIEVWYDPTYEHNPFIWAGVIDLAFYATGATTGWLVDYLA